MLKSIAIALLMLVAGCASDDEFAKCKGSVVALNPDHWTPTAQQMAVFQKMCAAEREEK